ncbi:MAG: hypothetical protein KatS3mg073_0103 [Meiothermus sp.]|uniref:Uncharacterized protein n=1 Tax=Meiothermus hypogaeus NBRC 106114 TaxID=1227553 RepID=A0A511QXB4_9DEIN|nr:hypothetical protein [Meiothermus hypogaeus]GEM82021.1 hypothetical protein MHY01S_01870 [Meiothermus hypogaeus NBRC 106114]GIW35958.1 MAG: hypothetical protein KatS3mg073_0103 [Meiothermus sp.]
MALLPLYTKALLRNPWALAPVVLLPLLALAFLGRGEAVAVVSLFASLALLLPPFVLALSVPLLTLREDWAFWAGMPQSPARLYLFGVLGVGLGFSLPILAGLALAAGLLGLGSKAASLLMLSGLGLLWVWVALAGWVGAGLEPARALGVGLLVWGVLVLAYDPLVVGLAVALRDYPLEGFLLSAVLLNPLEMFRVGLLYALEAPVLVGPTGYLLKEFLGYSGGFLPMGAGLLAIGLGFFGAGWRFAQRDR